MIIDGLEFHAIELTKAQMGAGLRTALAELAADGITPFQGAFARDVVSSYDELTCRPDGAALEPEEDGHEQPDCSHLRVPTEAEQRASAAYGRL